MRAPPTTYIDLTLEQVDLPRHKAKKALARGQSFLEIISSGGSLTKHLKPPSPPPQSQSPPGSMAPSGPSTPQAKTSGVMFERTNRSKKKIRKHTHKRAPLSLMTVETDTESEQDEEVPDLPPPKPTSSELAGVIRETAKVLQAVGDARDIQACLTDGTFKGDALKELHAQSSIITNLLSAKMTQSAVATSTALTISKSPSTMDRYDNFFVYRAPSQHLYVLKPLDVFKGTRSLDTKVVGWIRWKGGFPLNYSLSGWKVSTDDHPKMLDPEKWTERVEMFTELHGLKFGKHYWDVVHEKEHGYERQSHVEIRLMLWFACNLLVKAKQPVLQSASWKLKLGHLDLLKHIGIDAEAEIILTKEACDSCKAFKKWFQKFTGLKFKYLVCNSLTTIDSVDEEEDIERFLINETQTPNSIQESRLEVVVHTHSTPPVPGPQQTSTRVAELSTKFRFKTRHSKHKQRARDQGITPSTPPTRKRNLKAFATDASDSDDTYQDSSPLARKSKTQRSPSLFDTPRSAMIFEGSAPEKSDGLDRESSDYGHSERREKKKRERDASYYPSPPSGKKARRSSSSETL